MGLVEGKKIGFLGAGRMGAAIFEGFLKAGLIPKEDLYVSDINQARLDQLKEKLGMHAINTTEEAGIKELVTSVDILVISILPQLASKILPVAAKYLDVEKQLVVSHMGGIETDYILSLMPGAHITRVMPNTPMCVNEGVAGICKGKLATDEDLAVTVEMFNSVGLGIAMPENMIQPLTGISGCGPAFCAQFIGALADGGVMLGLSRDIAIKIAAQTLVGTGKMVLETGIYPETLKDDVCSPGGGTIAGCITLDKMGFRGATIQAVENAVNHMADVAAAASK